MDGRMYLRVRMRWRWTDRTREGRKGSKVGNNCEIQAVNEGPHNRIGNPVRMPFEYTRSHLTTYITHSPTHRTRIGSFQEEFPGYLVNIDALDAAYIVVKCES